MKSSQPVALVTGASRGIGRYLAEHLCTQEYCVVGCSRSASDFTQANYEHVRADVTSESDVQALTAHIRKHYGRLDVVLNNAGLASMNPVLLTPLSSARAQWETSVTGTFLICRECVRLMIPRRLGRIVNFTSIAVPLRLPGEAMYAAAKSAVETLTRILAQEVGEYGITVNAIGPSPVDTDLIRGLPKDKLQALIDRQAVKRLAAFADVANVIDFFIQPESAMITGQVLYLGGIS